MLLTFCKHRERVWLRLAILGRLPLPTASSNAFSASSRIPGSR